MRPRLSAIVALACCLLLAGTTADAARPRIAVLGMEPRDPGDARSQQRTAALARALTDGLRARASQGGYDIASGSQKDLLELKMLSGCFDEAPECMAAMGRDLGAELVVYGHVERRKDASYAVSVRSIVVGTRRPGELRLDRTVSAGEATEDALRKLAPQVFPGGSEPAAAPMTHDTALIVDTNVDEGTLFVNGVQRGQVAPKRPTTIRGLPPGMASVAISAPGHRRAEMSVDVREGQTTRATLNLEPAGLPPAALPLAPPPAAPSAARPGGTARVLFWTSLVATGAGVAAFTVTGLQVRSIENEQDDAIAGFDFSANGGVMNPGDACAEARSDNYARLVDICDRGKRMATVTNVLIGATAAAAVATAIFYWRGYLAPGSSPGERASLDRKPIDTGVLFGPSVYKNGAGFGATIQF
jgi:hypothetical protein